MSEFDNLIASAIDAMKGKGHWLESGTINVGNELWSYKLQKLKKKPSTKGDSE